MSCLLINNFVYMIGLETFFAYKLMQVLYLS
jgi:hypothetical protein